MVLPADTSNPPYPRPDFDRSQRWFSLGGGWEFASDPHDQGLSEHWQTSDFPWTQRIIVPFAWETPASGIEMQWMPVGWYRRVIQVDPDWRGMRIILHFGAVHYHASVWLNGQSIGDHTGGYLPFMFDITEALDDSGAGTLVVRVEAPVDKRAIPHGKQRSLPPDDYNDCAFTASSGIWQPVWLEPRPATYVQAITLRPSDDLTAILAEITLDGPALAAATVEIQVNGESPVTGAVDSATALRYTLAITNPQRWTPEHPHLYTVRVRLNSPDGEDSVSSYTGLRNITIDGDRVYLNGDRIYLRGALDQGFWPETGYTPPNDDALRRDVELALGAGFNLIRKHIKLEDPSWLYWADRLGLLVWAEPPCIGRYSPEAIATFEAQLAPMVTRDGNHPSIVLWGIYNEEWGLDWKSGEDPERQAAVAHAYDLLAAIDHSRPIIDDSGWWHVKTDIVDWHYYNVDMRLWCETSAALARDSAAWYSHGKLGDRWYETQLSVAGSDHRGRPVMNGEYGGGRNLAEQGWLLRWQTADIRRHDAFCGYIYTELYDVEYERVGIYTAQRELKSFGFATGEVHAPTVLILDVVPVQPGVDFVMSPNQGEINIGAHLSHHGTDLLTGHVCWGWDVREPLTRVPLAVAPFAISPPVAIRCTVPKSGSTAATLHIWFEDNHGQIRARSHLDVVLAESDAHVMRAG